MSDDNVIDINGKHDEEDTAPDIYAMELHEQISVEGGIVWRVPGGWLYSMVEVYGGTEMALPATFVPYSGEFKTE